MLSINNNDYDHIERERKVIELYNQGKYTRNIAKELRMSLRDISIILRKNQVNHGIVTTTKDNWNDNNDNTTFQHSIKYRCCMFILFPILAVLCEQMRLRLILRPLLMQHA